ncbi:hypothetical protein N0V83_008135 [Neocucurbitaria cava]|uniref:FAD-binding domain-containing protein n=1 Tax=Neocucurbitaria cava TaxID=798079 RepID=A0A9W8Y442_9PLEO|nr:hypothetical protein N0V83_008135 [Neocucurbitaria cava]
MDGWDIQANFIVDPEHWFMAARISDDGLWRITYGEKPGFTRDQLRERLPEKFKTMLPGHPEPSEYKVANFAPYKVHQRLAKSMRVGRFLLAADAAHLCNPLSVISPSYELLLPIVLIWIDRSGGLGLTGGIVDVGNLYDCLRGIYENKADESILDQYNEVRRNIYLEIVDVVSSSNLKRLFDLDPDRAIEQDPFFQMAKKAETDPEFSKTLQNVSTSRGSANRLLVEN